MIRRRGTPGVGLAAAALWALALAASAHAAAPKSFFGVVSQGPLADEDFERMGTAEVGTLRFQVFWAGVDRTSAAQDYDWSEPDAIVGRAAGEGIQALPFLYGTPTWVARLDGRGCRDGTCAAFAPRKRDALGAWSEFLAAAVDRYGPRGSFWSENPTIPKLPIRAWQLWNEQNSPSYYEPKPDATAYAKLVAAGHDAILAEDGEAEIVLGGMFGTPLGGRKPGISASDFLGKLYDVKGAKRDFDGVAPHPYGSKFKQVLGQIDLLRDEIKAAGDARADLWITEIGWASGGRPNPLNRGLTGQADRLTEAFEYFRDRRKKLDIRNLDWFSWRDNSDPEAGLCEWCPESGLVTDDLAAKPSLQAFTKFTGGS